MHFSLSRGIFFFISLAAYGSSYYAPQWLWWGACLWPLILWGYVRHGIVRWYHGYVWTYVVLVCQLGGIFYGAYQLTPGYGLARFMCIIAVMLIIAVPGGLWFWIAQQLRRYDTMHRLWPTWWLTTWLYLIWMEYASLLILGDSGCILISPLLPISIQYSFIWPLAYIGRPLFLAWWLWCCMTIAYCIGTPCTKSYITFLSTLCVCGILWYKTPTPSAAPPWINRIGVIRSSFLLDDGPQHAIDHCAHHVQSLARLHPELKIFILPESSFYHPSVLMHWSDLSKHSWSAHVQHPVIFGGYHVLSDAYRNTIAFIEGTNIISTFDKHHATPFIEKIPFLFRSYWMQKFFYKIYGDLSIGTQVRSVWEILPNIQVVPYICSEIFCGISIRDTYRTLPILALCNTQWAPPTTCQLMLLGARLRAIEWQRDIMFIAQYQPSWCGTHGEIVPLTTEEKTC